MSKNVKMAMAVLSLAAAISFTAGELYSQQGQDKKGGEKSEMSNGCCPKNKCAGENSNHINRMQEKLGLTDEQVEKIFKINTDYRQKIFENRKNSDKVEILKTERQKEIENILTKEQKDKIKNKREKCRGMCWY